MERQPYKILGRIFVGLTTDDDIELGILQTHQCTPAAYRVCLGLDPDAPPERGRPRPRIVPRNRQR